MADVVVRSGALFQTVGTVTWTGKGRAPGCDGRLGPVCLRLAVLGFN